MGGVLAIATVVKSMTGAGLLGLPRAFAAVGLTISGPGCVILAMLNVLGVVRLLQAKHSLDAKQADLFKLDAESGSEASSASETIADSIDYGLGPVAVAGRKLFGTVGVALAALGVLGTQLGPARAETLLSQSRRSWRSIASTEGNTNLPGLSRRPSLRPTLTPCRPS